MTDQKRLPVWIRTSELENVIAGDVRIMSDQLHGPDNSASYTRFVPDVPRCATCSRFSVLVYSARCQHEPNRHVPVDGSGYCHEHLEANR